MALINVRSRNSSFNLLTNETLLQGLERTGHEVKYQCKKGYCGLCRIQLISGEVSYEDEPLALLLKNEILPCCCTPKTNLRLDCELKFNVQENNQIKEIIKHLPVQQTLFELSTKDTVKKPKKNKRIAVSKNISNNLELF